MTPARLRAFTLVELLMVLLITSTITAILLPSLSGAREQARLVRELSAGRNLMTAYFLYADENDSAVVPGVQISPARDDTGADVGFPVNKRYPWKLAPYFDYQLTDCILVHAQQAEVDRLKASGSSYAYSVSVAPSFGVNAQYVGGHDQFLFFPQIKTVDEPSDPSSLLCFVSARSTPSGPGSDVEGYFEVRPPIDDAYDPSTDAFRFGFVHPRYSGAAVTAAMDGHAETLTQPELHDMRRWADAAARADDPDWVWTP